MELSQHERQLLDGARGEAARTAAEILVALGEIYGAERLLEVRSVQIAGVSYHNLGDAGLDYLEEAATDGRVMVPATLNPAGMDLVRHREMGISEDFAHQQARVISAFERMGVTITCTCTPYLVGNRPGVGDSLAWSESSAVTFANSVLGARTNREGGPSALAAALCGRTPAYGLHLDKNRRPTLSVEVETPLAGPEDWGLLGAAIGRAHPAALPFIRGVDVASPEALKALSAALPTYGGQPMFHLEGITPEAGQHASPADGVAIGRALLEQTRAALEGGDGTIDLVALGCPHASIDELGTLAKLLDGRQVVAPLWISTSRGVRDRAAAAGLIEIIEASGARVWSDTCFAVAPLKGRFARVATDSAKGAYYGRGHNGFAMRVGDLARCVEAAVRGRWS